MADFEENIEEMAGTTREVAATESGGNETEDESGGLGDKTGDDGW